MSPKEMLVQDRHVLNRESSMDWSDSPNPAILLHLRDSPRFAFNPRIPTSQPQRQMPEAGEFRIIQSPGPCRPVTAGVFVSQAETGPKGTRFNRGEYILGERGRAFCPVHAGRSREASP